MGDFPIRLVSVRASAAALVLASACVTSDAARLSPVATGTEGPTAQACDADRPLRLLSWNLGYAGLGAESDFIAEGGKRLRPASADLVRKNATGAARLLADLTARPDAPDLIAFQELAGPGLLTRNVDVVDAVRAALPGYRLTFSRDVAARLWPGTVRLVHGPALAAALPVTLALHDLPDEPKPLAGLVPRNFHALVADFQLCGAAWSVIDIHLAAYETTGTREAQLAEVMRLAQAREAAGRAVVVIGDFNMGLRRQAGAADDAHPFPHHLLPAGWRIAADPDADTVRDKAGPWRPGVSRTSAIDGLVVSPRVEVRRVTVRDDGFRHSDHQPVEAVLGLAPATAAPAG